MAVRCSCIYSGYVRRGRCRVALVRLRSNAGQGRLKGYSHFLHGGRLDLELRCVSRLDFQITLRLASMCSVSLAACLLESCMQGHDLASCCFCFPECAFIGSQLSFLQSPCFFCSLGCRRKSTLRPCALTRINQCSYAFVNFITAHHASRFMLRP